MPENHLEFDPREWHNIQPPEEMDAVRHFEYDGDAISLLRKWLRLDERTPKTIVEVGCGSGYFTEKLIRMASEIRELVAIEPDDVLREYAQKKLSHTAHFLRGTAEDIPLPDEFADLTTCHVVLNNLPDVHRALTEMTRVTRTGGIVATIEPGEARMRYSPDPKLDEMEDKAIEAFGKGIWDLRGKLIDYSKDLKKKSARYPEVFHSCGLKSVEAHGILSVFLLSDSRRDPQEILNWLKKRLALLERDRDRTKLILQRGGLSETFIHEYHQAEATHLRSLIEHPERISKTHELQTYSRTVTVGFKPRK
jgi:ubiquinone/menaquinone biosynthesis C-methylase UbiE